MTKQGPRTLAIALALMLAVCAAALASGPLKGKTYEGALPAWGASEGHTLRTHTYGNIVLRVSANGRSITVRFTSSAPVLYCRANEQLHVQSTKAATISSSGSFKAAVAQRFRAGPGPPGIVQIVTGRFSGHSVRGTIHTHASEYCGGVASFSAKAR